MKRLLLLTVLLTAALGLPAQPIDRNIVTHGPWITFPDTRTMTVGYTTPVGYGAGVEYRPVGTSAWKTKWQCLAGQIMRHRPMHAVTIPNLKPDTEYEYRLLLLKPFKGYEWNPKLDVCKTPQVIRFHQPNFTFKTFPDGPSDFTVALTSDLQFNHKFKGNLIRNFYKNCDAGKARFFAVLGDCHDSMSDFQYDFCQSIIDPMTELGNQSQPGVFTRGNHEWRGADAPLWCEYFPAPKTKVTFFSFSCGNVFFIVLDSGEDKPPRKETFHYTGLNVEEKEHFTAQREWLKNIVKSDEYRKATFRVVLCHTAIYSHPEKHMTDTLKFTCGDLFKKNDANPPLSLWIAGHTHLYARALPNNENTMVTVDNIPWKTVYSGKEYNFPVVTLDGPGNGNMYSCMLHMTVKPDRMLFKAMLDSGEVFDEFQINADASFVDLRKPDYKAKDRPIKFIPYR